MYLYLFFRYKEIAGSLENAISDGLGTAQGTDISSCEWQCVTCTALGVIVCVCSCPAGSTFHLQVSEVLWSCLVKCWSDKVYLPPLAHRLWKLTLQLYARYAKFLEEVNQNKPGDKFLTAVSQQITM